jgi:hypothetical protein
MNPQSGVTKVLFRCSYHTGGYVVSVIKLIRHSGIEMHETIGNIHGLKLQKALHSWFEVLQSELTCHVHLSQSELTQ